MDIKRGTERSKSEWKKEIKRKINKEVEKIAEGKMMEKKKLRFIRSHKGKDYVQEMEAEQVEMIMRVKLNIIRASNNKRNTENCRLCKEEVKTTEHLRECSEVREGKEVTAEEIKAEDKETLTKVERRLKEAEEGVDE